MVDQSDAAQPLDRVALLDAMTDLVDLVNAGEGGLPGLQSIVDLARAATGSAGATFAEYSRSGGRIVAATGEFGWSLGRPIDTGDPHIARFLAGGRVRLAAVDEFPPDTARHLRGRGIRHTIRGLATVDGALVGSLQAHFTEEDAPADDYRLAAVKFFAAGVAHLYRESAGLPVYPDGPVPAPLGEALAVVGPDATVRSWSPIAERLTGRTAADAIGAPLPFPVPGAGQLAVHRLGPGRWAQVRSTALIGTDASVVTFRETAEPEPRDQARDLFIAVTSHELRTPVTVIRGYADTLVEHWDLLEESARREAVFVVGQRARELARLVDRLLKAASDVAGLGDGAGGMPFELVGALREAVAELPPDLREHVRTDLPGTLPKVVGDRASLSTVVTELVTNACKYSPEWVDVELTAGADAQTVWFRVADRGLGIRPEHAERAFERFWQLDRGDQRRYGGVGLGLYLVRRIVERQSGWVSLRPRAGGGTVAEVRLPRADANSGEA